MHQHKAQGVVLPIINHQYESLYNPWSVLSVIKLFSINSGSSSTDFIVLSTNDHSVLLRFGSRHHLFLTREQANLCFLVRLGNLMIPVKPLLQFQNLCLQKSTSLQKIFAAILSKARIKAILEQENSSPSSHFGPPAVPQFRIKNCALRPMLSDCLPVL